MNISQLGMNKKPSLTQDRERLEKEQGEAISKAVNGTECAVKEKHVRSVIIGTWREKGASIFWNNLGKMPLPSQVIMCWKAMMVIHKMLREGHPNVLKESQRYKQLLEDMSKFWKHSAKGGHGRLIHAYLKVLVAKLDFHRKNEFIPGTLMNNDGSPLKYSSTDINDYFQLAVEVFDYQDALIDLEKAIFSTLDPYRSSSQITAVQCRICPFPVIIQECSGLYDTTVDLMFKLHASLPLDTLTGHRDRFYYHFKELKSFFFDAGNMSYVKALVHVPKLPEHPPTFAVGERVSRIARRASFDGQTEVMVMQQPFREPEPKRQSLMEPLATAVSEPVVAAAPPSPVESDLLGMSKERNGLPDERDRIISQLKQENYQLRLELDRSRQAAKSMEDSLRAQIGRLEEELKEYKTIAEQACAENTTLRAELESKEEDKKDQKMPTEEKFVKLKTMYGKLREEHVQLLRSNASIKTKMNASEKAKEEVSQTVMQLQQELEDKSTELLEVYQKAQMAEEGKKVAEETIQKLTKDFEEKDTEMSTKLQAAAEATENAQEEKEKRESKIMELEQVMDEQVVALNTELSDVKKTKEEIEQAKKTAEETIESERHAHSEKVSELSAEISELSRIKEEIKQERTSVEETLQKERKEFQEKIASLAVQLEELNKSKDEVDAGKKTAEETVERNKNDYEDKIQTLNMELSNLRKSKLETEEANRTAEETIERERSLHKDKIAKHEKMKKEDEDRERQNFVVTAVVEAEKTVQDSLDECQNPKHNGTTCTAEYLLNRIEGLPDLTDQLSSRFSSYRADTKEAAPFVCSISTYSHQLGECILNIKSTSHMAPPKEAEELQKLCEAAGKTSLELFALFKNENASSQSVSDKVEEVKRHIKGIADLAEALAPREQNSADKLGSAVDEEINNTAQLVADAASRIEEMLSKSREKYSGVQLEVHGRILDSCTSLMKTIKELILKSKDLQQEIVEEGQGTATAKEFYKRHSRWTEGLLSAAKAVGWGAKMLVDSADKVVQGKGKFEEIIVSSNEIAASTAQLVAASRVKAHRESKRLAGLQSASKNVAEATAGVVASVKTGAEMIEDSKTVPDYSKLTLTQAKRYEMDAQVLVLELESRLTKERERLGKLRRIHYQLANVEEDEAES